MPAIRDHANPENTIASLPPWTGRHRRSFFDVSVLNAMSRVSLASGKIVHTIGNDVGVKQRPVASQIFLLHGFAGVLKPAKRSFACGWYSKSRRRLTTRLRSNSKCNISRKDNVAWERRTSIFHCKSG